MTRDISEYINFEKDCSLHKTSIKSLINKPITVKGWEILESKFRDENPSGKYAHLSIEVDEKGVIVNTGSGIIMEQLAAIKEAKEKEGETDLSFTCVIRRCGGGMKMYPMKGEVG